MHVCVLLSYVALECTYVLELLNFWSKVRLTITLENFPCNKVFAGDHKKYFGNSLRRNET